MHDVSSADRTAEAPTSTAVDRDSDVEAYDAAGGVVSDLFDDDQSRLLSDPALLQSLTAAKLAAIANEVRAEGWTRQPGGDQHNNNRTAIALKISEPIQLIEFIGQIWRKW